MNRGACTAPSPALRPQPGSAAAPHHDAPPRVIESGALLQGQRVVCIRHQGEVYRLQTTRQGKLILTK